MKLPEYANFDEKNQFFNSKLINSKSEFDSFYTETVNKINAIFRGVHEAKYKIYTSAQREWCALFRHQDTQGIRKRNQETARAD